MAVEDVRATEVERARAMLAADDRKAKKGTTRHAKAKEMKVLKVLKTKNNLDTRLKSALFILGLNPNASTKNIESTLDDC